MAAENVSEETVTIAQRLLNDIDLSELRLEFQKAPQQNLSKNELHELLQRKYSIHIGDEKIDQIFEQIDINGDGVCNWEEFVSYLMVIFNATDPNITATDMLNLPIEDALCQHQSNHMYAINRIRFSPSIPSDGPTSQQPTGIYLTCSKDGTINMWDIEFQLLHTKKSSSPSLKVNKTWILDFIYLANIQIICTSSIECDIRFYDTRTNGFQLQLIISKFPWAINTMSYWWPKRRQQRPVFRPSEPCINDRSVVAASMSKIVLGDSMGNVILFSFDIDGRDAFENNTSDEYVNVTWTDVLLYERLPLLTVRLFENIHSDAVTQIEYSPIMNAICSASNGANIGKCDNHDVNGSQASFVVTNLGATQSKIVISVPHGVQCFALANNGDGDASDGATSDVLYVVTGGADSIVRLWNPSLPDKPMAIFPGHHAGIIYVFTQDKCKRIYSFDKCKVLKVWNVAKGTILQTYNMIAASITDRCFLTAIYNDATRELIIGGMHINTVRCCPILDLNISDGSTHQHTVSVILYNHLFDTIVTCGFDSSIISWNLGTGGNRLAYVKSAHTMIIYGETVPVEITAACFNPNWHFLLTGASDGTMKVWNFNSGVCVRNLSLDSQLEVTALHWLPTKILAVGWHKCITEFSVSPEQCEGHEWLKCHNEDILSCAINEQTNTIATGSHSGELILWTLETGQPYRKCYADNPSQYVRTVPSSEDKFVGRVRSQVPSSQAIIAEHPPQMTSENVIEESGVIKRRELSLVELPQPVIERTKHTIQAMLFLTQRRMSPAHGTLTVALGDGKIQIHSHHNIGTYIDSFEAIHMAGDGCVSIATDKRNEYIFVGTTFGYIKTWLIVNYCVPADEKIHVNRPKLRLQFPFLSHDFWKGRAKRSTRPHEPVLVNSYKAHIRAVSSLQFIDDKQILMSSSADWTVRLWTLGGRYIRTLGSIVQPNTLWYLMQAKEYDEVDYRVPPDIRHVASSTTMKVMTGGSRPYAISTIIESPKSRNGILVINEEEVHSDRQVCHEGATATESGIRHLQGPILGAHFTIASESPNINKQLCIDQRFPFIPVYREVCIPRGSVITAVPIPDSLEQIQLHNIQHDINALL